MGRADGYIVLVTHSKAFNIGPLTIVDVNVKRSSGVCEFEVHNLVFKLTRVDSECSLELFSLFELGAVVGNLEILWIDDLSFVHLFEYI
jgi:hypothetical protein